MSQLPVADHFAERLTGPGRGAVAVIRFQCSLLSASHPADQLFRSIGGRTLSECKVGKIMYGDWRQEDVVVVRTSDTEWEVNCHGGPAPVQRIMTDLQDAGLSIFADQKKPDSSKAQCEWRQLLLNSKTIATADLILSQPQALNAFSHRLNECQNATEAVPLVAHFLSWKPLADHLVKPWIVAIVGQPNAGKSSFLNAVVGYQRSIVFDQPGTTRDLVQCDVVIGGWPVQLVDTAGIRNNSQDDIEQQGIQAARKMIASADICLVISDHNAGWCDEDTELLDAARLAMPVCVVHNKCDLPAATKQTSNVLNHVNPVSSFQVNSIANAGIQPVIDWISDAIVPVRPTAGEPLPILQAMSSACEDFLLHQDLKTLQSRCRNFSDFAAE